MTLEHLAADVRLHIVGGPASGKTTLARRLAAIFSAPAIDLDTLAYEGGAGRRLPDSDRIAAAVLLAQTDRWISEGIYLGWTEPLMERAQAILWLDLPRWVSAYRCIKRHFAASLSGQNPHPGVRNLMRFIAWQVRHYHGDHASTAVDFMNDRELTRGATEAALRPHATKVLQLSSTLDVSTCLRRLQTGSLHGLD